MRLEVEVDEEALWLLRQMAGEAETDVATIVEVAVYNLIACWLGPTEDA